jgi:hypothetical protein
MALDGLNAAVAAAILNKAQPDVRTRGVVLAAFVPGALGLALPFVLSRQSDPGTPTPTPVPTTEGVIVPDISSTRMDVKSATARLELAGLVVAPAVRAFSLDLTRDQVISQNPSAGTAVTLGSTVTLTVSDGPLPPKAVLVDIDAAALTTKIQAVQTDLDGKIDALQTQITNIATTTDAKLQQILDAVQNPP